MSISTAITRLSQDRENIKQSILNAGGRFYSDETPGFSTFAEDIESIPPAYKMVTTLNDDQMGFEELFMDRERYCLLSLFGVSSDSTMAGKNKPAVIYGRGSQSLNLTRMFAFFNNNYTNNVDLSPYFKFSFSTGENVNMMQMFQNSGIKTIPPITIAKYYDYDNDTQNTFSSSQIQTIQVLTISKDAYIHSSCFSGATGLSTINFSAFDSADNGQIKSNLDLRHCPLNITTLTQSIHNASFQGTSYKIGGLIYALHDFVGNSETPSTTQGKLTLKRTAYSNMTTTQKAIITNKGWTVSTV